MEKLTGKKIEVVDVSLEELEKKKCRNGFRENLLYEMQIYESRL